MVRDFLPYIYPGMEPQEYIVKARRVMRAVWRSSRRFGERLKYAHGHEGDMYVISMLYESKQWEMAPELKPPIEDHHNVWEIPGQLSPMEIEAVRCYFTHKNESLKVLKMYRLPPMEIIWTSYQQYLQLAWT